MPIETTEIGRSIPIIVTENQKKVIEDKYLRGEDSIETWLKRLSRNIALAELLYHPNHNSWGLFNGVRVFKRDSLNPVREIPGPSEKGKGNGQEKIHPYSFSQTFLFHHGLHTAVEREKNFRRFIENCQKTEDAFEEARQLVSHWASKFYELLATWTFLPNSPTLMNAGRDLQQLSACFVVPVEDSMEGITHALQAQALIHKSGGGTGFSFGNLRPMGDTVQKTHGVASGSISFMKVFDRMTEVVKQGGNRRGANMGILPYWHPEIREFIQIKSRTGTLENFNLSVAVDEKFFQMAEKNEDYDLINPRTKESAGKVSASQIFDLIIEMAWRSGDPGLVFLDKINNSASNSVPGFGPIMATNPCGEQPLYPNEACNLGSLNLLKFVKIENGIPELDWDKLKEAIDLAVRFLDNVIDMNDFPLPEIEQISKGNRRIGLGVMGFAETLIKMGIPYGSPESVEFAKKLMAFINEDALNASEKLGEERGVFPNWKNSIYNPASPNYKGETRHPRHSARTTIAPTGTIGLAAGLQGAGIEPFYALAYTRYNGRAIEALKTGATPDPQDIYYEVNPLFKEIAAQNNFFGLAEKTLWEKIEHNKKSIKGIPEIPERIQALFATAQDIPVESHIEIQAAFQDYTDNAVSKTINLPHDAPPERVKAAYLLARQKGLKGITIYRDGSRQQQVLNTSEPRINRDQPEGLSSSQEGDRINAISHTCGSDHTLNLPETKPKDDEPMNLELWTLTFSNGQCPKCLGTHIRTSSGCRPVCNDCGYSEC
ncbi:MAG: adenosylcobalamin-dependent ribonucleoside-diphosphate reductase [Elusimicrobia bacterium]|nr:adenosylcobalamin-dependent ribonucleoside-diphosphate reductase [Candidatus Obscuribacterium magneticum]